MGSALTPVPTSLVSNLDLARGLLGCWRAVGRGQSLQGVEREITHARLSLTGLGDRQSSLFFFLLYGKKYKCVNLGTGTLPSLTLLPVFTDACCHHPGVPIFHDALKVRRSWGW